MLFSSSLHRLMISGLAATIVTVILTAAAAGPAVI